MSNDATRAQIAAADPLQSTWLSANAGSGKTKVLTDRVARLLLGGVRPERILCLTYTKAAAAEMQNRLFKTLGEWAMLPDDRLGDALSEMGVDSADNTTQARGRARTLFARAIETPGGLKIQTIHSFCAALLRRFPLEAGVSPRFTELDDLAARRLRAEVLEDLANSEQACLFDAVARHLSDPPEKFLARIAASADGFTSDEAAVLDALDARDLPDAAQAVADAASAGDLDDLARAAPVIDGMSVNMTRLARNIRAVSGAAPGPELIQALGRVFFYSKQTRFKPSYLTGPARGALGPAADRLDRLGRRVEAAARTLNKIRVRDQSLALHRFARAWLERLDQAKLAHGWLDFDDLIRRAESLLTDPAVAQWVLFRLDGGIDHILVDEAQDTSPRQWNVVRLLAAEFTTGEGARADVARTIFVVGDKKQSIYSFQGADPDGFDRMRDHFRTRLEDVGQRLQTCDLLFSFRSALPVLRAVDSVFERAERTGLGAAPVHRAFHTSLPGRVDLWPVIEKAPDPEEVPWYEPRDIPHPGDHQVILAQRIARWIQARIGTPVSGVKEGPRAIHAGDFLILVQRRGALFHAIIRACKALDLPIAGADRLKVGGELAVRDICAFLAFLATPEDDLSLATCLRSPLFGLDEDSLHRLARGRGRSYLWQVLRRDTTLAPWIGEVLDDLRRNADFLRPYDLIERLLTRHAGRQRLVGRLGPEAEDGIDALLAQALAYEASDVPSLTGFLDWMQNGDVEIKREADQAGDRIRVMSVHGAKGLESPIVILPDSGARKVEVKDPFLRSDNGAMVWKPHADSMTDQVAGLIDREKRLIEEERMRLLYVAMTRAEKWLVVAAGGAVGKGDNDSWYNLVRAGLAHQGCETVREDGVDILRYAINPWPRAVPPGESPKAGPGSGRVASGTALPDWSDQAPGAAPQAPKPISPSDLGGAKALPGEGLDEAAALARGSFVHRLLEVWPDLPPERREPFARTLSEGQDAALLGSVDALVSEAARVLEHPDLAHVFAAGTLAETPVCGPVAALGGKQAYGIIDRLVIAPDRVLAVDYKTNRQIPAMAEHTPEGVLRQMAAYREMLALVFPGREIEMAIVWTAAARLMPLPARILARALKRAAPS